MSSRLPFTLSVPDSRKILLVSFEDAAIENEMREAYPDAVIVTIAKEHIIGRSPRDIIRQIRADRYTSVVISNRRDTVQRTKISLKVMALAARARIAVLIFSEENVLIRSRFSLGASTFPLLIGGLVAASVLLLQAWGSVLLWTLIRSRPPRTSHTSPNSQRSIAYLRTDLSGGIRGGGSLTHMLGVVDAFRKLGHSVFFVSDDKVVGGDERGVKSHICKPSSLLGFFDEMQLLGYHFRMIKCAGRIFNEKRPDILYHRHSIFNFSSVVLAARYGIPVILEVNYSEVWAKEHWSRLVFRRLARHFEKIAFRHADCISVVSERVKEDIVPLGADPDRIVVNPNGVDTEIFRPDINGSHVRATLPLRNDNDIIVGFVGTFTRWHGVEALGEAIKSIAPEYPHIHFFLIGEGTLKGRLEEDVRHAGLQEHVTFPGLIPHHDIPQYLAACDILVSPHLGFESGTRFFGSPTKLFEYMAMGKAVIASALEQLADVIRDGVNGVLMEPGNAEDLAQKILLLAADPSLRTRLGEQARSDVLTRFTWQMNAQRVLNSIVQQRSHA